MIIRAKVPPPQGTIPKRNILGMNKCTKFCLICAYIKERKTIKTNNITWTIRSQVNCNTQNIVYLIECNLDNCKLKYVGETERDLKARICEIVNCIFNLRYVSELYNPIEFI